MDASTSDGETTRLLDLLSAAKITESDAALGSLVSPQHPYHKAVLTLCLQGARAEFESPTGWRREPFASACSAAGGVGERGTHRLRTLPTIRDYAYRYVRLNDDGTQADGSGQSSPLPSELWGTGELRDAAPERTCDVAAQVLASLIWTLPRVHPLFWDNEERLNTVRSEMQRFAFRSMTTLEERFAPGMIPDIVPLGRPATSGDVAAGKALFSLDGRGTVLPLKLPAWAIFTVDIGMDHPRGADHCSGGAG